MKRIVMIVGTMLVLGGCALPRQWRVDLPHNNETSSCRRECLQVLNSCRGAERSPYLPGQGGLAAVAAEAAASSGCKTQHGECLLTCPGARLITEDSPEWSQPEPVVQPAPPPEVQSSRLGQEEQDPGAATPPVAVAPSAPRAVREESIREVWIAGILVAGIPYLMTVGLTPLLSDPRVAGQAMGYVLVPVAGPFLLMTSPIANPSYNTPLLASALLQTVGVSMVVAGLAVHRQVPAPGFSLAEGPLTPVVYVEPALGAITGVQLRMRF